PCCAFVESCLVADDRLSEYGCVGLCLQRVKRTCHFVHPRIFLTCKLLVANGFEVVAYLRVTTEGIHMDSQATCHRFSGHDLVFRMKLLDRCFCLCQQHLVSLYRMKCAGLLEQCHDFRIGTVKMR